MSAQPNDIHQLDDAQLIEQIKGVAQDLAPDSWREQLADLVWHQFTKAKGGGLLAVLDDLTTGELRTLLIFLNYRKDKRGHNNTSKMTVEGFL